MTSGSPGKRLRGSLARGLGIPNGHSQEAADNLTQVRNALNATGVEEYYEEEPSVRGYFSQLTAGPGGVVAYLLSLLPFLSWIGNYNLQWLAGDLVAGITVGAVVVPQSMAYAQLAELPVEYGLYTSFMGVLIYFFFATSKDITIGVSRSIPDTMLLVRDIDFPSPSR